MKHERYSVGWTDPRGMFGSGGFSLRRYGAEHITKKSFTRGAMKVDDHKYTTEAKDLPIETCVSMWVIKYGDGEVAAVETAEQDALMWEIGNRLWWANRLKHNREQDTYEIID